MDWNGCRLEVKKDPAFYEKGRNSKPSTVNAGIGSSGSHRSIHSCIRKGKKEERDFNIMKIGLELPKEELHRNINTRADKMIEAGLVEEVKRLLPYKHLNALQTVGYAEIFDYLDGKISLKDAIELIKTIQGNMQRGR